MATLAQIYAYEQALEEAWASILNDENITCFRSLSNDEVTSPRIEVSVTSSGPTGHRAQISNGQWSFDAWNCDLVTRIISVRGKNSSGFHDESLSSARTFLQYFQNKFTESKLPYHVTTQLEETGMTRTVDDSNTYDISELSCKVLLSVRPSAWPTGGLII